MLAKSFLVHVMRLQLGGSVVSSSVATGGLASSSVPVGGITSLGVAGGGIPYSSVAEEWAKEFPESDGDESMSNEVVAEKMASLFNFEG